MNRRLSVIALLTLTLALFTFACTSMSDTPNVRGRLTAIEGKTITVTPADGQPVTLNLGWNTDVFWANGVTASGTSVLTTGQSVEVWTKADNNTVTKIVIAQ